MLFIKLHHRDGSIVGECANRFIWDSDHPATFKYEDFNGAETTVDPAILRVFVYFGTLIVFTRDLRTGQPVENFNV